MPSEMEVAPPEAISGMRSCYYISDCICFKSTAGAVLIIKFVFQVHPFIESGRGDIL